MAEVMNMPVDSLDQPPLENLSSTAATSPSPPSPPPPLHSQPPLQRRKDRDPKERRDDDDDGAAAVRDREADRYPNRQRGGDYYGRNLSPTFRDRDRDYKRRRSPSPGYRDRRYSPPRRISPGPKRYRKDDYDRRGSPRGGFGPDDRRMGYDQAGGGYERGTGGRGFYSSSRPYGRSTNPPMSNNQHDHSAEMESSRELGAEGTEREGLMSYKQFIQDLEDDILPSVAERRYMDYRSGFISTQKQVYFEAHKCDEWLKDMYHPTNLVAVIERRNAHVRGVAKEILLDLQSGTLDIGPNFKSSTSNPSDPYSDDDIENGENRRWHSRGQGHSKESDLTGAPKADAVSSQPRRVQADIRQTLALVRKLDAEKGIEENILCPSDGNMDENKTGCSANTIVIIEGLTSFKGLEGTELLDTLLTYLWRVHGLDYYGMIEMNDAKGLRHVRADTKQSDETMKVGDDDWEKRLDSFYQERLNGKDPLEKRSSKEKLEAATAQVLEPYVRKIRDEKYGWKYGCGAKGCTKLFHAAEFVHKHLKLKHSDVVTELTSKVHDDIFQQNYMSDPDSPGGAPIMRKLSPKDKAPRRRIGMDGRLRDDRGGYQRDHARSDRKRYEMSDNSPRDYPSESGDLDGENPESTYDSFRGGQGIGAFPPLSSDVPPVLMPVPGAGPLGPFVPAPPEVAMRMMREQGGSSSYEGSGRKKSSAIDGPLPIISIPSLRQDPRRIRSYQDLDAPEDEVTVIDYRSL